VKRSAALAALSRDHHQALEVALRLRRAQEGDVDAAIERFLAFWRAIGARHFEIEEQLLLPALPDSDAQWRAACERVRDEHARLRAAGDALAAQPSASDARAAGELLHDHVRFEERELFGLLEERLDPDMLAALGHSVEEADSATARSAATE
jgi:hemerythrin-like domain-containing protein